MLNNLFKNLSLNTTFTKNSTQNADDTFSEKIALAALMVRLARSDDSYSKTEEERIMLLLAKHYALDEQAATALRHKAQEIEKEAADTVRFTREIKQVVPHDERIKIIEMLWAVVLEDGKRDAQENTMMRLIASLLGISDIESNSVRKKITSTL